MPLSASKKSAKCKSIKSEVINFSILCLLLISICPEEGGEVSTTNFFECTTVESPAWSVPENTVYLYKTYILVICMICNVQFWYLINIFFFHLKRMVNVTLSSRINTYFLSNKYCHTLRLGIPEELVISMKFLPWTDTNRLVPSRISFILSVTLRERPTFVKLRMSVLVVEVPSITNREYTRDNSF